MLAEAVTQKAESAGIPSYTLRESRRARYVWFKVTPNDGLVVVVPRRFDHSRLPNLLRRKQQWILRTLARVEAERLRRGPDDSADLVPPKISLRAIGQEWRVAYEPQPGLSKMAIEESAGGTLTVLGSPGRTAGCRRTLRQWLRQKAYEHLVPWLKKLSEETGLSFSRVSIRSQRTRWGSCSKEKSISINQHLLFMPSHLVRHVLIHELCHTQYLDHSRKFWTLFDHVEPGCRMLHRELRRAGGYVPSWVYRK